MSAQATPFDQPAALVVNRSRGSDWIARGSSLILALAALAGAGAVGFGLDLGRLEWSALYGGVFVLAGARLVAASRHLADAESASWRLIGWGVIIGGLGHIVWGLPTSASGSRQTIDLFSAGFRLFAVVGLLRLPALPLSRFGRVRVAFDSVAGTVAVIALIWEWRGDAAHVGSLAIDAVLIVTIIAVALRQSVYVRDIRLGLLLSALLPVTASHAATSVTSRDLLWFVSASLIGVLGWRLALDQDRRNRILGRPVRYRLIVPYLPVVVVAVLVGLEVADTGAVASHLGGAAVLLGLAVAGRTFAAVRENRHLIELERDQILASMSHELRTPLTAVSGFAELLTASWETVSDDEGKEMSAIIYRQSKRLVDLVSDMAAMARSELDAVELEHQHFDGKSMVSRALVDVFDGDVARWNLRAEVEPFIQIYGDPRRTLQMIVAIIENAKKYGNRRILIVVRRERDSRAIEVHDDGPGVSARHQRTIWNRFERGPHQLDGGTPGSGLGLARVRDLAAAHAGTARYRRSERLGGACFAIVLPYE